jgi:flagellar M-ring protein FliF
MDDRTTTFTPGDRTITRSTTSTPTLNRLSVAVVVPVTPAEDGTITPPVDDQTVQRVLASAAGLDQARGDTIEVASVPANAADTGELITEEEVAPAAPASSGPMTMLPGIGIGVGLMVVVGFLARRRRKKKAAQVLAATSQMLYPGGGEMTVAAKGRKAKKAAKAGDTTGAAPATMQMPVSRSTDLDPDHQAVEEIRADLERMLAESPESLAALLSAWMAK